MEKLKRKKVEQNILTSKHGGEWINQIEQGRLKKQREDFRNREVLSTANVNVIKGRRH